jgi:hypothetical protein
MAHLVQHGAVVLALGVFGKVEGDDVPERQRLASGWVPLELLDVRHDVDDVEDGAIWRARLQDTAAGSTLSSAHGKLLILPHAPAHMWTISSVTNVQQWLVQRGEGHLMSTAADCLQRGFATRYGDHQHRRQSSHRILERQEGDGAAVKWQPLVVRL